MTLVTTRKAVAPEPTDTAQAVDKPHASSKSDSISTQVIKLFSSRHKVAPAPSERAQSTAKANANTKKESQHPTSSPVSFMPKKTEVASHGKTKSPQLEDHPHSNDGPKAFPVDRNPMKSSNTKSSNAGSDRETDSHGPAGTTRVNSLVRIERDATIHEL